MTRLFRNPNIKVGDKVRIHAEPIQPNGFLDVSPEPEEVGSIGVVTAINTYYEAVSLDYDARYRLADGSYGCCDCQYLEVVQFPFNTRKQFYEYLHRIFQRS